jgi:putative inorganic carbon (HCO3(-)) transporter
VRDVLLILIVFGSIPFIFRSPVNGVLMWVWISVMNPQTQTWGFAHHIPFALVIAIATMAAMVFTREPRSLPWTPLTMTLLAFALWMNITLPFSMYFEYSLDQWNKVMKIMLMNFVVIMLVKSRHDIHRLMWVLVISLGYYGVKGGLFTIRTGGSQRVWGPGDSFIGDNNAIALALIMVIPLIVYVQQNTDKKWIRHALTAAILLCTLAALGSYSRGAFLAIGAMAAFLWLKSRQKVAVGGLMVLSAPLLLLFMPEQWTSRMDSINDYQGDSSAMGRLNAWQMAFNLACDRFFGGGFEIYGPAVFAQYAPNPADVHAAHSVYFQVLGEHGFVGLGLYLLLGVLTWRCGTAIVRRTEHLEQFRWASSLARMVQTSLVGFAVGGAFLSLVYFDVPYYLMAAMLATHALVERELAATKQRGTA